MEFDKILKERHCARTYSAKKVEFKDVVAICEAALSAPMAGNIFTLKLVVVSDKKKKQELAEAALGQEFLAEAGYIIVVCSDISNVAKSYDERGKIYARQQAGAAIENMFLKATDLGLGTCWIGAFDENAVRRILNIPDSVQVEALLPVGYERVKARTRIKPQLKNITNFEMWTQKTVKPERRDMPFKR
jgi:hypothetical protein